MNPTPRRARILVYGVTGSGKTTLAEQIGRRFGLPWHPVDDLTWEPGWIPVPTEIQRSRIQAICDRPAWVLDSAYGAWLDIPLSSADLVVCLDFPRWLSLGRLLRRTAGRLASGELVCNGNRERLRDVSAGDSIVVWHFRSFKRKRERMRRWHRELSVPRVLLFRSPAEVGRWLERARPD